MISKKSLPKVIFCQRTHVFLKFEHFYNHQLRVKRLSCIFFLSAKRGTKKVVICQRSLWSWPEWKQNWVQSYIYLCPMQWSEDFVYSEREWFLSCDGYDMVPKLCIWNGSRLMVANFFIPCLIGLKRNLIILCIKKGKDWKEK